ncbi:OmpA family protein [Hydrotalea sp.]|uniref:OmpA/MotB family protein n=1 Tax=Hydrotalea sp. TaxID=2881279 RepID=UPI002624C5CC|nr:OmpA family protein [Hydrotalea sp.]
MIKTTSLVALSTAVLLFACVSPKKLKQSEEKYNQLNGAYLEMQQKYRDCQGNLSANDDQIKGLQNQKGILIGQIDDLNKQIDFLKQNNTQVLNQLKDMSVISASQAESIKKSMDNMSSKDSYIQQLQTTIAQKDSMNMALVMNLKGVLGNFEDSDINIKVDKDVVYIDISDKLLFKSGSYDVTDRAKVVLGKVAKVLNNQPNIEFMVEGNTDSIPFKNGLLLDNWDLSVKRATSVVRILQNNYGIDPKRITAAGRGQYVPIASNDTPAGRAANRRTRIIILPQLDQFFKLLERPKNN